MSSPEDCVYVNMHRNYELDIDQTFGIDVIKGILYDEVHQLFFLLCNKYNEKLGFYVMKIAEHDPHRTKFMIKWKNKSDIGDPFMCILEDKDGDGLRELIIAYKVIYINVYRIESMDIGINEEQSLLFRHESFQLWESECQGLLLRKNKDFVRVSK